MGVECQDVQEEREQDNEMWQGLKKQKALKNNDPIRET